MRIIPVQFNSSRVLELWRDRLNGPKWNIVLSWGLKNLTSNTLHLYPCLRFFFLDLIWTLLLFYLFYFIFLDLAFIFKLLLWKVTNTRKSEGVIYGSPLQQWPTYDSSGLSLLSPTSPLPARFSGKSQSLQHFVCTFFFWSFSVDFALLFF